MSSPTPEDDIIQQSFSISLTVYSNIKKKLVKGKTSLKEEKSTKTKELLFAPDDSNYIKFLQAILLKHGLENYEVTEKKHFPLKYIPPKTKGQQMTDSIDVDNSTDYKEMVKKVLNDKPLIVKVFVDMRQVEKLPHSSRSKGSGSSAEDSVASSDSINGTSTTKQIDLKNRLGRWRARLEKAHKNENDVGLTFVGPNGPIPLSPAMIRDWCLTLEDGHAMLTVPPNIESFRCFEQRTGPSLYTKSYAPVGCCPCCWQRHRYQRFDFGHFATDACST
ncbi:hypothetical protein JVT61DRAFT_14591 [Boletus reticuloceps]|uniref:Uncharacterized protein n=1 Tax=Boletus reticuloceps TaxID=495285 RepID=A0A8I2YT18_9AGAM|nr:hypothetical protein JVT61DRAFT_14591 [Boletus reticuloceps]